MNTADERLLRTCGMPAESFAPGPHTIVIFGGAGDLAKRMLIPALYHLHMDGELPAASRIIGVGLPEISTGQFRDVMTEAMQTSQDASFDADGWQGFRDRLSYIPGSLEAPETYRRIHEEIQEMSGKGVNSIIYYLAVPSGVMEPIVGNLDELGLCKGRFATKIIVEKPFGADRESAMKLNRLLLGAFDESQIFRIDYYLAIETVQNILFFRFANSIFERLWDSHCIDNVQITVAEELGMEQRGRFYEQTGVVRDMVQNHLLQMVGLIAMEPPVGSGADPLRDERVRLFRAIRPMRAGIAGGVAVRGQYAAGRIGQIDVPGYRQETDVAPESGTATYFAGRFEIDNERWRGVPFYVRTGKRMARNLTQVSIQFKSTPHKLYSCQDDGADINVLYLTLVPEEKIDLSFGVKYPHSANQIYATNMEFSYFDTFHMRRHPPYERLLVDCMRGDLTLFVRQDGAEAAWGIVDPLIEEWETRPPVDFPNYAAGAWGPAAADDLLARDGRRWLVL